MLVEAPQEVGARGPSEERPSAQVGSWARLWLPPAEGVGDCRVDSGAQAGDFCIFGARGAGAQTRWVAVGAGDGWGWQGLALEQVWERVGGLCPRGQHEGVHRPVCISE